jgi:hypothetical protein
MRHLVHVGLGVVILAGLLLARPAPVPADTIDLHNLQLRSTTARILDDEIDPIHCAPTFPDTHCGAAGAVFDPEMVSVNCAVAVSRRCTYELTLCLEYELFGASARGGVAFTVDGTFTDPGPFGAHGLPRQPLGADTRTCTTVFSSGNARGPHKIGVVAGVDNNLSGGSVSLRVRNATLVIRVYGE